MAVKLTEKQQQVIDYIQSRIKDFSLAAGEKLESESSIAKSLGITRVTVREATRHLEEQGIIYKVKGSGLYVGTHKKPQTKQQYQEVSSFDHQAEQAGKQGIRKVLSAAIIPCPTVQIAHALKIKPTEMVYHIVRLMSFGSMPVALEHIHIPVSIYNGFEFHEIEQSKYTYLERLSGKKVETREQDISACNVNDDNTANLLQVDIGQAMIELREVVYFDDGTPFEYNISKINSDLFNIHQITKRT
ncbi:GntR family transcriptional regulator [Photobacterium rosenbergii]|uniref:GntR family transcriptional regulator n=1 Tax=Photobacterium rosenbergii TaxID=294936 RepID=UPI001C98F0DE|nr:GntR family transcriptional regulator [Photobacterium rosenbergii]MBY5946625.1 GntR family transcriptional regulator [Photobacterium rosenbergii]